MLNKVFRTKIWTQKLSLPSLPVTIHAIMLLFGTQYSAAPEGFLLLLLTLAASYMRIPEIVLEKYPTWKEKVLIFSLMAGPTGSNKVSTRQGGPDYRRRTKRN
jgi:hypothetical protein